MTVVSVTMREGESVEFDASPPLSVMEVLRDNGVDELLALCGGCLSCASCHVFVREDHLAKLPPRSQEEEELLSESPHMAGNSRLSCQIELTDELDELAVTIAPED